jgi:hypothetical protein
MQVQRVKIVDGDRVACILTAGMQSSVHGISSHAQGHQPFFLADSRIHLHAPATPFSIRAPFFSVAVELRLRFLLTLFALA